MVAAAQAFAFLRGENETSTIDDIKAIAPTTMEHVILLHPRAENELVTARKLVQKIIDETLLP